MKHEIVKFINKLTDYELEVVKEIQKDSYSLGYDAGYEEGNADTYSIHSVLNRHNNG